MGIYSLHLAAICKSELLGGVGEGGVVQREVSREWSPSLSDGLQEQETVRKNGTRE